MPPAANHCGSLEREFLVISGLPFVIPQALVCGCLDKTEILSPEMPLALLHLSGLFRLPLVSIHALPVTTTKKVRQILFDPNVSQSPGPTVLAHRLADVYQKVDQHITSLFSFSLLRTSSPLREGTQLFFLFRNMETFGSHTYRLIILTSVLLRLLPFSSIPWT